MTTILGIDPGSRITGYGIIRVDGSRHVYVTSGCIRVREGELTVRLQQIFKGLQEVVQTYVPDEAAIEQVFFHRNAEAALKLGQARGAAIVALAATETPVAEYSARQIKQSVVGYGAAKKEQVQHMVRLLLNLTGIPQVDAADALAVALCHAQSRMLARTLAQQESSGAAHSLLQKNKALLSEKTRGKFRRGRMR
jgi:crossover junction endodeoxyribonuclease RuvC